jgi:hypothetical protein
VRGGAERALEFNALEGGEREERLEARHSERGEDAGARQRYTGDPHKGEGADRGEGFLGHLGTDVEPLERADGRDQMRRRRGGDPMCFGACCI